MKTLGEWFGIFEDQTGRRFKDKIFIVTAETDMTDEELKKDAKREGRSMARGWTRYNKKGNSFKLVDVELVPW